MKKFVIGWLSEQRPKFDRIEQDKQGNICYYSGKTMVQRLSGGMFYRFETKIQQVIQEAETLDKAFEKIRKDWPYRILQMIGTEI